MRLADPTLPIVANGRHDLSIETHSIRYLEAHADSEQLRDIQTASVRGVMAERFELTGGCLTRGVPGLAPGAERYGAMQSKRRTGGSWLIGE